MKTKTMKQNTGGAQYRQGDVLLERISALPAGLRPVNRDKGRVVLAYGEVTGHAHALVEPGTQKFTDDKGAEFYQVAGERLTLSLPFVRRLRGQVMVKHPMHGLIEFAAVDVDVVGDTVHIDGKFGLLKHDEHNTQALPAGIYKGAGHDRTVHQREYTPEAIRRVAD
jgi:hypothetical protein